MKTWLIFWNSNRLKWDDPVYGYEELLCNIKNSKSVFCKWTDGISKRMKKGDRFFLIKDESKERIIIASGYFATDAFECLNKHSNEKLVSAFLEFDKLLNYKNEGIILHSINEVPRGKLNKMISSALSDEIEWEWRMIGNKYYSEMSVELKELLKELCPDFMPYNFLDLDLFKGQIIGGNNLYYKNGKDNQKGIITGVRNIQKYGLDKFPTNFITYNRFDQSIAEYGWTGDTLIEVLRHIKSINDELRHRG